jgi:2-polyprenyl-3-methyl-5-hydroxy-6-metoxy-1,4-benzoquinol methylase
MPDQEVLSPLNKCLVCNGVDLFLTLDLGEQPLANEYLQNTNIDKFPLAINTCQNCWHTQLTHAVNPERLYRDYKYVSGTSDSLKRYFKEFRDILLERHGDSFNILSIGENDGTFLELFKAYTNIKRVGVDPAENLQELSKSNGIKVYPLFWNKETAQLIEEDHFNIITAINVLPHVYDPRDFLEACKLVLSKNGHIYVQISQANTVTDYQFDCIYHEHHSYFSVRSMKMLCESIGLQLIDVEMVPIHGGSYRFVICHEGDHYENPSVQEFLNKEKEDGRYDLLNYISFSDYVKEFKVRLINTILDNKRGKGLVGYASAAKGHVVINYTGIKLDYVVDENKLKVGYYVPGTETRIVDSRYLSNDHDDLLIVITAWNFYDEIKEKIKVLRPDKSDLFLRYFPVMEVSS